MYDFKFQLLPAAPGGKPSLRIESDNWDKPIINPSPSEGMKIRWITRMAADGWTAEVAIPRASLKGLPDAGAGQKITGYVQVVDVDAAGGPATKLATTKAERSQEWSYLMLED